MDSEPNWGGLMHEEDSYQLSIVIPVYRGEQCLPSLIHEIATLAECNTSPAGNRYVVTEVLLVHDCGPDHSDRTIEALCEQYSFTRPIWLSRNFGQHAATLAGMASTSGDWIVTIDEDGQHNPADIGSMLDRALSDALQVVYAEPRNSPPHGIIRNTFSWTAKAISSGLLGNEELGRFSSYRLIDGEIARTLAAYCGSGVYLDVALYWIAGRVGRCPVLLRSESRQASGYSYRKLVTHFWNLILTTGTRPLRLITVFGFFSMALALAITTYALYGKFVSDMPIQGWASLVIVVSFFSGSILTALGVIAEYLAVSVGIALGKPLYIVCTKPTRAAPEKS